MYTVTWCVVFYSCDPWMPDTSKSGEKTFDNRADADAFADKIMEKYGREYSDFSDVIYCNVYDESELSDSNSDSYEDEDKDSTGDRDEGEWRYMIQAAEAEFSGGCYGDPGDDYGDYWADAY